MRPVLERVRVGPRRPACAWRARLWREWCFARVAFRHARVNFLLLGSLLLGGALLFRWAEPEKGHSFPKALYYTWSLIFGQPPEEYPRSPALQILFFVVPLVGLLVIIEGLVDFSLVVRDRRRNERGWCRVMANALSNHIILVGLGKLGYRTFRLLRQIGEPVAVIESDPANQFLEEIRREGSPLFVGDARRETLLADANVTRARSIILATNDDLANLEVALDARRMNPQIRVVLRMFDQNMADKVCAGFGIQTAMSQSAISAPAFVTAALQERIVASQVIGDTLVVMQTWTVGPRGPLADKTIADVMTEFGVTAVEHRRAGRRRLMPPLGLRLEPGDELLIQGPFETLAALRL